MQFLHPDRDAERELSLEDVFLVPSYFAGHSRLEVDLPPGDFPGSAHPVVSANMNAVTGKRMAETMARSGGLGVLPQDMQLDTLKRIVGHIKAAHVRFDTPLEVTADATLRDVQGIMLKRSHGMVIVVDQSRHPIGIITPFDLRERDQYTSTTRLMSTRVVKLPNDTDNRTAYLTMKL